MRTTFITLAITFVFLSFNSFSQVNKNSLETFFSKKLNETQFTSNALPHARNAATRFLALATLENFEEVYSYDKITNGYTIQIGNLPYNLQRLEWGGSKDAIKRNAFGQFTAKADKSNKGETSSIEKKYNSLVSGWLTEYLSTYSYWKRSNINQKSITKRKGSIKNLSEYIVLEIFNNSQDACRAYLNRIENEDEIRNKMMNWTKTLVTEYEKDIKTKSDKIDFKPIDAFVLKAAINRNDWNTFLDECNKIGWTPTVFLRENGISLNK